MRHFDLPPDVQNVVDLYFDLIGNKHKEKESRDIVEISLKTQKFFGENFQILIKLVENYFELNGDQYATTHAFLYYIQKCFKKSAAYRYAKSLGKGTNTDAFYLWEEGSILLLCRKRMNTKTTLLSDYSLALDKHIRSTWKQDNYELFKSVDIKNKHQKARNQYQIIHKNVDQIRNEIWNIVSNKTEFIKKQTNKMDESQRIKVLDNQVLQFTLFYDFDRIGDYMELPNNQIKFFGNRLVKSL